MIDFSENCQYCLDPGPSEVFWTGRLNRPVCADCLRCLRREEYGPAFVYALIDPRDCLVRYIGSTGCVAQRWQQHCAINPEGNDGYRGWLRDLKAEGIKPEIKVLDRFYEGGTFPWGWKHAGPYWYAEVQEMNRIAEFLDQGHPLVNIVGVETAWRQYEHWWPLAEMRSSAA